MKSNKEDLLNPSFSINLSNILTNNCWKKSGLRKQFPEAVAKKLPEMKTTGEEEVYKMPNMTSDTSVEFEVYLSDAETEATT